MGLYRRGKIWWMAYMVDGRQHCESTGASNKRVAQKILDVRRAEIHEGRFASLLKSHVPNLENYSRQYIDSRTDLHPNTKRRYECSKKALDAFFGKGRLPEISEARLEEFKSARLREGAHAAGVNRDLAFLRLVLRKARRERYIAQNPLDGTDLFLNERKGRIQAHIFSVEEEQLLLAGARGYLKVLILLLVDAGLRVGKEALPLKWKDLDLTNEVVHVRESKTLAGIRSIPLTDRLRTQLVQWRHMTGPECSEFVFFYPLNPSKHLQKVPKSWARALKKAGIPYTRIYDLRATFSTRLNVVGIQQVIVDQLLGHSGGLAQTYTKAIEEIRRDAIAKLNAFVNAQPSGETSSRDPNAWVN
ncbi:MAG: tyrosine-type recombinase/integrase [Candidatus Acidiferrales bacterium]